MSLVPSRSRVALGLFANSFDPILVVAEPVVPVLPQHIEVSAKGPMTESLKPPILIGLEGAGRLRALARACRQTACSEDAKLLCRYPPRKLNRLRNAGGNIELLCRGLQQCGATGSEQ